MTIAEALAAAAGDDFGPGLPLTQEIEAAGGIVIDSSRWASSWQIRPWDLWEFPDGSQAFASRGRLQPREAAR
jgi:hypothetical protein